MAGIMKPGVVYDLVSQLKEKVGLPIILHTHDTAGLGAAAYMAGVEAGVDVVETSISPFANGTSQPDTIRMLALPRGASAVPELRRGKAEGAGRVFQRRLRGIERIYLAGQRGS